ncbi:MAG: hypothetical protein ABTQ25_06765 [Nitrosomonas ureae]
MKDWTVMVRVQCIVKTVESHDSIERYMYLVWGLARQSNHRFTVVGRGQQGDIDSAGAIAIATRTRPIVPQIPGLEAVRYYAYYTSDTIWSWRSDRNV